MHLNLFSGLLLLLLLLSFLPLLVSSSSSLDASESPSWELSLSVVGVMGIREVVEVDEEVEGSGACLKLLIKSLAVFDDIALRW